MQCHGSLRRPLRYLIKLLGATPSSGTPCASLLRHERRSTRRPHQEDGRRRRHYGSIPALRGADRDGDLSHGAREPKEGGKRPAQDGSPACMSEAETIAHESAASETIAGRARPPQDHLPLGSTIELPRELLKREKANVYDSSSRPQISPASSPAVGESGSASGIANRPASMFATARAPRSKNETEFSTRYFDGQRKNLQYTMRKRSRHIERLQERDGPRANDWQSTLELLRKNTTGRATKYKAKLETIRLPVGITAVFKGSAAIAILEIMQRTDSHIQMLPSSWQTPDARLPPSDSFSGLRLYGLPAQNDAAIKLLPAYVYTVSEQDTDASRNISDFPLSHELLEPEGRDTDTDVENWSEANDDVLDEAERALDETPGPSGVGVPQLRSVWSTDRYGSMPPRDELHAPVHFLSGVELTAHIVDLTTGIPKRLRPRHASDIDPSSGVNAVRDHQLRVWKRLRTLFANPKVARLATSAAVDRALQFLVKINNIGAARQLFVDLENGGYNLTVLNFGVLLAGAARAQDLHNFEFMLKLMLQHKIEPTAIVWAHFHHLMLERSPDEAANIATLMHKQGMLQDNQAAVMLAKTMVQNDLSKYMSGGGNLEGFFRLYDDRFAITYGLPDFNWLHTDVVQLMASTLLQLGQTKNAFALLDEFRRRSPAGRTSVATLNVFLRASLYDVNTKSAVAALQYFGVGREFCLLPDHVTYFTLFTIAWRARYFNMARVIWRYACTAGHVHYRMKVRMTESLLAHGPTTGVDRKNLTRGDVWRAWAGKFAVGVAEGLRPSGRAAGMQPTPSWDPSASPRHKKILDAATMGPWSTLATSKDAWQYLKSLGWDDMREVSNCKPVLPLADVLQQAWELDMQWKACNRGLPAGLAGDDRAEHFSTMMKEGIRVPMVVGDGTVQRDWDLPDRQ